MGTDLLQLSQGLASVARSISTERKYLLASFMSIFPDLFKKKNSPLNLVHLFKIAVLFAYIVKGASNQT